MITLTERQPFLPGEILKKEFMDPLGLTQGQLADILGVERRRINEIVRGKREITSDTAIRLGKAFRTSPVFWLNLQVTYNLWLAEHQKHDEYSQIRPIKVA